VASDTSLVFNIIAKDNASKHFSKLKTIAVASLAAVGAVALKFGADSIAAYSEAQEAQTKLADAYERFPKLANGNIEALRELNEQIMAKTRFDDDALASAQATLATFNLNEQQIRKLTPLMADYAAKTGKTLPEAASALGKSLLGSGKAMKEIGVRFKDTGNLGKNFDQIIFKLQDRVGGFAEKDAKTATGQTEMLKNQFGELQEKVGAKLVPALLKLVPVLQSTLAFIDRNGKTIAIVAGVLGTLVGVVWLVNAAVKAYTAVQVILNIAMSANPVGLIIIAIAALIGIIVLVATKTKFFQFIWSHVWAFLKMVGAWFAGPFVNFFKRAWGFISGLVVGYFNLVIGIWKKIFSFIGAIPGKVRSLSKGMWNGIIDAFRGVINLVIRAWNALDFSVHVSVPSWVPGIGGMGFHIDDVVPDIPYLAQGGVVKASPGGTLAVLGEGGRDEAVIPLSRGGGGLGTQRVVIELRGADEAFKRFFREILRKNRDLLVVG